MIRKGKDPLLRSILQVGRGGDMFGHLLIQLVCVYGGRCHQFFFLCYTPSRSEVFVAIMLGLLGVVGLLDSFLSIVFRRMHAILALLAPWLVGID